MVSAGGNLGGGGEGASGGVLRLDERKSAAM